MARGTIYCIAADNALDVHFDEKNYYDVLDVYRIDYVKNMDKDSAHMALNCAEQMLRNMGADIQHENVPDGFLFSFCFKDAGKAQEAYFRPKLEYLKKQVNALTLCDVLRRAPSLDFIMDNDYGDLVAFQEKDMCGTMTLDEFIRQLKCGVTYHVYDKTILMH